MGKRHHCKPLLCSKTFGKNIVVISNLLHYEFGRDIDCFFSGITATKRVYLCYKYLKKPIITRNYHWLSVKTITLGIREGNGSKVRCRRDVLRPRGVYFYRDI